jgi:hypothetical protein
MEATMNALDTFGFRAQNARAREAVFAELRVGERFIVNEIVFEKTPDFFSREWGYLQANARNVETNARFRFGGAAKVTRA